MVELKSFLRKKDGFFLKFQNSKGFILEVPINKEAFYILKSHLINFDPLNSPILEKNEEEAE